MERTPHRESASRFRAVLTADGSPGPIEERLGRRLVRVVGADTTEGRRLVRDREVEWIAPGGERLGRVSTAEALDRLRTRLEARLADPDDDVEPDAVRDGLLRLRRRRERLGRA